MDRVPAEAFHPGDFLKEEMEARGWTQADLAAILGRPVNLVNEIIVGKRGVTPEMAKGFAAAFDTSAQYWMNLDSAYQLWRLRKDNPDVSKRAKLFEKAPIMDMLKRNWIGATDNVEVLERRVLDFFRIKSLDDEIRFRAHAARKSTNYTSETPAQTAWLFRASHVAGSVATGQYSQAKLREGIERLKSLLANPNGTREVPRAMAECGVRFVIIEPLPRTRIDGASFWLDEESPVLAVSLRYDRIDGFWHTVMHEVAHILNEDGVVLDLDIVGESAESPEVKPGYELKADSLAAEWLVPQAELINFEARVRPLYSKVKISGFANRMRVHPGIIVGQLQHAKEISYSNNREMLVKVRDLVTEVALTDGWGHELPADL